MENGTTKEHGHDPSGQSLPPLQQMRTEGSVILTPEMFERMYLAPPSKVSGDLRKTIGNPTPFGLAGFLIAYSPIIFSILGWRESTGKGAATTAVTIFSGGLLAVLAMIFELILGNTFPATFFGVFGSYFIAFGCTAIPYFNAVGAFADPTSSNPTEAIALAANSDGFLSGIAFWNLMMAIFTLFCTICAIRVNLLFTLAFFFLILVFLLLAGASWTIVAGGSIKVAQNLQLAGGAVGFIVMVIGWYLLLALMLTTVDFPFNLPVFDLSQVVPSGSSMRKKKMNGDRDMEA